MQHGVASHGVLDGHLFQQGTGRVEVAGGDHAGDHRVPREVVPFGHGAKEHERRMVVPGVEVGGDEGVVGEAVPAWHFVEQAPCVAAVGRGASRVHEEDRVGWREGGRDVARLEEGLVQLLAGYGAAGAEELDVAADVDGDGHEALSWGMEVQLNPKKSRTLDC